MTTDHQLKNVKKKGSANLSLAKARLLYQAEHLYFLNTTFARSHNERPHSAITLS